MCTDFATLERIAKQMCDTRWGEGRYEAKGAKRAYWRRLARDLISKRKPVTPLFGAPWLGLYRLC